MSDALRMGLNRPTFSGCSGCLDCRAAAAGSDDARVGRHEPERVVGGRRPLSSRPRTLETDELIARPTYVIAWAFPTGVALGWQETRTTNPQHSAPPDTYAHQLPQEVWRQIWSNNPNERLNKGIRRRTDVVGGFPDRGSVTRLVGAVLVEQHDEWAEGRRYFALEVAGVSRRTISKLESDEGFPRRAYVIVWSSATGVQLHWIQTGHAETPAQGDPDGGCALCARKDSNPHPSSR
jgi:mutator family transposase